jgi:hypothetical protein
MFVVVEANPKSTLVTGGDKIRPNDDYRVLSFVGTTHDEKSFRAWVNDIWQVDPNLPIADLAKICYKGGWRVLQLLPCE